MIDRNVRVNGKLGRVIQISLRHRPVYRIGLVFPGPTGLVGFEKVGTDVVVEFEDGTQETFTPGEIEVLEP